MIKFKTILACAIAATCTVGQVNAGFTTFFGQDNSPGGTVPAGGNAATARSSFLANLTSGVGVEDFEGIAGGTTGPISLTFPGSSGSIGATLTGSGSVRTAPQTGGFNTTSGGSHYFYTGGGGDFNLAFSSGISAFGFYGTDIGDIGGNLVLTLSDGTSREITLSTSGSPNGALLFWGFVDDTDSYTNIAFTNTGSGDQFGFDDMVIGDIGQVDIVPEPTSLALWGLGTLGFGALARRRRKQKLELSA